MTDSFGSFMGNLSLGNRASTEPKAKAIRGEPKAKAALAAAKANIAKPQKREAETFIGKIRSVHTHLNGEMKKLHKLNQNLDKSDPIAKGVSEKNRQGRH